MRPPPVAVDEDVAGTSPVSVSSPPKPVRQPAAPSMDEISDPGPLPTADADGKPALERIEPRKPLSELSQALPPRPKPPGEWKGTILPRPVATAAGLLQAKGYSIALSGIDPVMPEETCGEGSVVWPCGIRARAAFRAFLRGRSITCVVPPDPEPQIVAAGCMVGKADPGAWLVANGWARATADSYAALGDAAKKERKGIFGPPPPVTAPSSIVTQTELPRPPDGGSILALPSEPTGSVEAPTAGAFPTPPAPPPAPAQ